MASRSKRQRGRGAHPPTTPAATTDAPPHAVIADAPAQPRWMVYAAALVIVALGLIAYSNSIGGDFVFDDYPQIVEKGPLRGTGDLGRTLARSYRPLTDLTFALNVRLSGADPGEPLSPVGFHVVNVLIHLGAALALFGVVRRTLLLPRFSARFTRSALWIAFAIAAVWIVHPLQTQAVTYIVQRAESLMGLCYVLVFYGYVRGATAERRPWLWFGLAVIAATIGMMSKAVMVTAPLLLVLYELCFFSGTLQERLRRRGPALGAIAATWMVLAFTGVVRGVLTLEPKTHMTVGFAYRDPAAGESTWWRYFLTQPEVLLHYLRLSVWPRPLMLDYNWPLAKSFAEVAAPILAVTAAGVAAVVLLIRRSPVGFLAAAFFVILGPTSSFVPIKDAAFEHRMYLPLAAVIALVVTGITFGLRYASSRGWLTDAARRVVAVALLLLAVAPLTAATIERNSDYHDAQALWRDVLDKQPDHPRAMNNLAAVLVRLAGQQSTDEQRRAEYYAEACTYFQQLADMDRDRHNLPMPVIYYNLANCYVRDGNVREALPIYEQAVSLNPKFKEAQIMYGNALSRLKRFRDAIEHYDMAIAQSRPNQSPQDAVLIARAYYNRGNQYDRLNEIDRAIESYAAAARTSRAYAKAYYDLGRMYQRKGDSAKAAQSYRFLLNLMPDHAQARQRLARLEAQGF